MIRWQDLDPARVERAVKMLIRCLHSTAQGIDGSGGDDGRDIRWDSPDGLVLFEVKSYAARLSSKQKSDIRASLRKAARHFPTRWTLILPLDPSPAEERWFDGLRNEFTAISLQWYGRDWLDYQFANHESLRRYVEGTDYALLQRAAELSQEQAVLSRGVDDLIARLRALHVRAQELSPDWRVDFTAAGETTILRISERGSPGSCSDPIVWSTIFDLQTGAPAVMESYHRLVQDLNINADVAVAGKYLEHLRSLTGKSAGSELPLHAVFNVAANSYYENMADSAAELVEFSTDGSDYLFDLTLERIVVAYSASRGTSSKQGKVHAPQQLMALACDIEEYFIGNPGTLLFVRWIYAPGAPTNVPSKLECVFLTDHQLRVTVYPYS